VISLDLTFDVGPFAQDQAVVGDDVALHRRVKAKRTGQFECALKVHALREKTSPIA
jgi:hypothetical protein